MATECRRAGVGIACELQPARAVGGDQLQRIQHGVVGGFHPLRVAAPGMRLDQDADAVAQREIAVGEARCADAVDEAGGGVVVLDEARVEADGLGALRRQLGDDAVLQPVAGLAQAFVAGIGGLAGDRDVVLELGAVGDVQVEHRQRIPLVDQRQHRLHFRAVGLHVVAVEVVALGGDAEAHLLGAALVRAVPGAEVLVAVDIEHRHEQQHLPVEQALPGLALQQVAEQPEAGVLAVDLAGMDAALRQHHRQAACLRGLRVQRAAGGDRHRLHRPALWAGAEVEAAHRLRVGGLEGIA